MTFKQKFAQGLSVCPLQAPQVDIFVKAAVHSADGRIVIIFLATSAAAFKACANVLVATNERFICTDNLSGTSPNGFRSFMYSETQPKYLER